MSVGARIQQMMFAYGAAAAAKVVTFGSYDASETDLTTYTFTAMTIGTAASDRRVHVIAFASNGGVTLSSATIGGVSATINVQAATASSGQMAIITANVPTGTTADVALTWSAGQTRCGAMAWYSTGLTSDAALATASATTNGATMTLTGSVNGGFALGGAWANGGSSTCTWTGSPSPTEDVDVLPPVMGTVMLTGARSSTTGASATMIATLTSFTQAGAISAAF